MHKTHFHAATPKVMPLKRAGASPAVNRKKRQTSRPHVKQLTRNEPPRNRASTKPKVIKRATSKSSDGKKQAVKRQVHVPMSATQKQPKAAALLDQDPGQNPVGNLQGAPDQVVPDDGAAVSTPVDFAKEFTISFKVLFDDLNRNDQMLVGSNKHTLEVQALGSKYAADAGKIMAWMKTESGLPAASHGRGVNGTNGNGELLSGKLDTGKWYEVKLQKTLDSLSLCVDSTCETSHIHLPDLAENPDNFDLCAAACNVNADEEITAGAQAGSGDEGLLGNMGDFTVLGTEVDVTAGGDGE